MKKMLFILTFCLIWEISWTQTIYTADNNPGAIGGVNVFTGATALADAIAAAAANDIIHVTRSSINYGDITIPLPLQIIGIGLDPDTDGNIRSRLGTVNIEDPLASGTRISGLWITTILNLGGTAGVLNNLLIENSRIKRIQHTSNTTDLTNLIIRNNVIGYSLGSTTEETIDLLLNAHSNVIIANNVLHGTANNAEGLLTASNGTSVENNLFLGDDGNDDAFENFSGNSVKNNIFIRKDVTTALGNSSNTFENNLSYQPVTLTFPTTNGNVSTGNLVNVNPLFVNVPNVNSIDFAQFDPTLQATSTAKGAGTDLTDIGLTGGPAPFSREGTLIPLVQSLTLPSMILKGDVLPVQIKAKGN